MIILKIAGIVLGVILLLILLLLALRLRIGLTFTRDKGVGFYVKLLCFTFRKKDKPKSEKEKKESRILAWLKKLLGFDIEEKAEIADEDAKNQKLTDKIATIISLATLLLDGLIAILKKTRLDRLNITVVCGGGDAADTAVDYGIACAVVYPLVGYATTMAGIKDKNTDVSIYCDFDGESSFEFEMAASVRIFHLVRYALRELGELSEFAAEKNTEENDNER